MSPELVALILAGQPGTKLLGKSLFRLALECVLKIKPARVYVSSAAATEELEAEAASISADIQFLDQSFRRALKREKNRDVLVLRDCLPLLRPATLRSLIARHRAKGHSLSVLGTSRTAGVYLFSGRTLGSVLAAISTPGRFDLSCLARSLEILDDKRINTGCFDFSQPEELLCADSNTNLVRAAQVLRDRKLGSLISSGVFIHDPLATWIDLDVRVGRGTTIYPSVIIEGKSRIGRQCRIYPFVHLIDSEIGNNVKIFSSSVVEGSIIEDQAEVGPFSRLRPKTRVRSRARVGNFVEMKNTRFGKGSKALHLSYLGDSEVKADVNIGAGTITCNYDGLKKHKTTIESGAFIGSGSELVAPVKVGKGAYVGAGSTITKDVSAGALAVARGRQFEKPGWAARKKRKK